VRAAFRDRSGATAIEFAILAPMFLATLFSVFEVGWLATKSNLLDRALDMTVRQMRIGSATAPTTQAQMKSMICSYMYLVSNCTSALTVEMTKITTAADFPSASAICLDRGSGISPVVSFTLGGRSDIVYVRACLVSDALMPFFGIALNFHKDSRGGYSIVAASAFMNEPSD
jgi:Flp pilus assembly protein TadG